jgi:hypothetical protein
MSNLVKKNLSSEEKQKMISDWRLSGLSKKHFADQMGLKYCTFIGWFDRYGKSESTAGFEQVRISGSEKIFAEVILGGKTIRFFQPFPAEYFQLLLR